MRKHLLAALMLGGAPALAVALTAAPVTAASTATWTVSPGGAFNTPGPGHHSHLTDTTNGTAFLCEGIVLDGTFKGGSGLVNPIGKLTFAGNDGPVSCGAGATEIGLTFSHYPMNIRAVKYNSATGTTTGVITGVHIDLSAFNGQTCTGSIDGTGASADDGQIHFSWTNGQTSEFQLTPGASLHAFNVSGCGGLISNGDAFSYRALIQVFDTATNGPDTITSP